MSDFEATYVHVVTEVCSLLLTGQKSKDANPGLSKILSILMSEWIKFSIGFGSGNSANELICDNSATVFVLTVSALSCCTSGVSTRARTRTSALRESGRASYRLALLGRLDQLLL